MFASLKLCMFNSVGTRVAVNLFKKGGKIEFEILYPDLGVQESERSIMDKSSYDKLFIFIIIIILSINIILGIVAITVSSTIYKQSRLDELQKIGDLFTSCMEDSYSERMNVRSSLIKKLHKRFSSKYHLMIYIYDESGNCVLSDADYEENPKKVVKNSSKISE